MSTDRTHNQMHTSVVIVIVLRIIGAHCRVLFDILMSEGFETVNIGIILSNDVDSIAMRVKTRHWQSPLME